VLSFGSFASAASALSGLSVASLLSWRSRGGVLDVSGEGD
jgi:hypothetical protein